MEYTGPKESKSTLRERLMKLIFSFLIILNLFSCSNENTSAENTNKSTPSTPSKLADNDCSFLTTEFKSYESALSAIEGASWTYKDYCSKQCARSSFINGMWFYTCDNISGYLVIQLKSKKYTYHNFPLSLWHDFKESESKGQYFYRYINHKGEYYFSLAKSF